MFLTIPNNFEINFLIKYLDNLMFFPQRIFPKTKSKTMQLKFMSARLQISAVILFAIIILSEIYCLSF